MRMTESPIAAPPALPPANPRPRGLRAVGLGAALWLGVALAASDPPVPASMERIDAALAAGRADEAERLARAMIRDHPGYAEAHGELARALEAQGRADEALQILLQVGQGLAHGESAAAGIPYLERALRLAPDSAGVHAALGHALLADRAYRRAGEHLRRAMELGERGLAAHIYLGSALWESGDAVGAEEVLRLALGLGRSLPALQTLGGFLVWRGEFAEAVRLIEEAVALDPGSIPLRLDLARALDGAGRTERAIAVYRRLTELDPALTEPRYALARLLRDRGEIEAAGREMAEFRRLHDEEQLRTHEVTLRRVTLDAGWELLRRGRLEDAAAQFERLAPSADSLNGLSAVQCAGGDHAAEVRTLERALAIDPERYDLEVKLARARLASSP